MFATLIRPPIILLSTLVLASCGSMPIADLSATTFDAGSIRSGFSKPVAITVAPAVSNTPASGVQLNFNLRYHMGEVEKNYVKAVAESLFENAVIDYNSQSAGDVAQLRLTRFRHNAMIGEKGFVQSTVIDEVVAEWRLFAADGSVAADFVFVGTASAASGWGDEIAANGVRRGQGALQNLYRQTVEELSKSPELAELLSADKN